jgi:hypothetical protein
METKSAEKVPAKYHCKRCDYITSHLSHWKKHCKTKKHIGNNGNIMETQKVPYYVCSICGKKYKTRSGIFKHSQSCEKVPETICDEKNAVAFLTDTQSAKDKQIETLLQTVREQNKTIENMFGKVVDSLPNASGQSIVGDNNNTIQNNNQFNIQLFLNEDCKNATSIQDFAKQLKITMDDLSLLRNNEPKAITEIITKNLSEYSITERPIHSHRKRWYVKDKAEGWEKDSGEKFVDGVKAGVSQKSGSVFVECNPEWMTDEKQGIAYAETVSAAMSGVKDKDKRKILTNLEVICSVNENDDK